MNGRKANIVFLIFILIFTFNVNVQNIAGQGRFEDKQDDTLRLVMQNNFAGDQDKLIQFTDSEAIDYLKQVCSTHFRENPDDPLKKALERLIFEASNPVFDSVEYFLKDFPFDKFNRKMYEEQSPRSDTAIISQLKPSAGNLASVKEQTDTLGMAVRDTIPAKIIYPETSSLKFQYGSFMGDSLKSAVNRLLGFLEARDSTIIWFTGISGTRIPFMVNSGTGRATRLWLRNEYEDSLSVWVQNREPNTLGLYLENGIQFRRPLWQSHVGDARIEVEPTDKKTLLEIKKIMTRTQYWKYRTESSVVLSQGFLSNWVKGGESSVSTAFDITAYADYNNKPILLSSNNFARIKYGLIYSDENGIRKNLDLLETNSKLNHKAFGKFDFSAIMLFKTQVAKGYNYPNDSIPVSKFFNPAILTIGLGLDYKPNKTTSLNFSPFSYKGTFVPDTAHIDQTKYGIPADKRSKNEPGASLMFMNEFKPFKNLSVTNRLQLFTNYINNPQNIDV
ncbi:MAG: DUF3078 domain-containing protein, partial [Bacteroidales bacterium]|nr:DUF3078 domain-containing protein [Bacteroidales bacterium]